MMAPLGANAADLVVWWEKGYYTREDEALREVIATFERASGKQVELVLEPQADLPEKIEAALAADRPPASPSAYDAVEGSPPNEQRELRWMTWKESGGTGCGGRVGHCKVRSKIKPTSAAQGSIPAHCGAVRLRSTGQRQPKQ
jgi:hypothetical protein